MPTITRYITGYCHTAAYAATFALPLFTVPILPAVHTLPLYTFGCAIPLSCLHACCCLHACATPACHLACRAACLPCCCRAVPARCRHRAHYQLPAATRLLPYRGHAGPHSGSARYCLPGGRFLRLPACRAACRAALAAPVLPLPHIPATHMPVAVYAPPTPSRVPRWPPPRARCLPACAHAGACTAAACRAHACPHTPHAMVTAQPPHTHAPFTHHAHTAVVRSNRCSVVCHACSCSSACLTTRVTFYIADLGSVLPHGLPHTICHCPIHFTCLCYLNHATHLAGIPLPAYTHAPLQHSTTTALPHPPPLARCPPVGPTGAGSLPHCSGLAGCSALVEQDSCCVPHQVTVDS